MEEKSSIKPPYVPFGTFKTFAESFREGGLPDQIDRSLMLSMSGTVQSMLSSALRSLGFIDDDQKPTPRFVSYIGPGVEEQRQAMRDGLRECYGVVFDHETSLQKMTQQQFDKSLREAHGFTASTLDKAASFFMAASAEAGIEISPYLQKRKATATRKRREKTAAQHSDAKVLQPDQGETSKQASEPVPAQIKPLQYQLIDLMAEPDFDDEHKTAVWSLVQYLTTRQKN
ncbi:MAG: DUF5343 domain-containing protein [Pseudomonadota bacterium]